MTRFFYATLLVAAATAGCPSRELPPPAESAPAPAICAGR
jgi:hypothetical protein